MEIKRELKNSIRKYAIKNAHDYGAAKVDNVLGKVVKQVTKDSVPELKKVISDIVAEVNALSKVQLDKEYEKFEEEFDAAYEKKVEITSKPRMILEGAVEGNFATRFPPEPSGYMHLGHASITYLGQEFARIYKGKQFLYFDDTDPEKEKQEYVDAIKTDLKWLGVKFDKEYYASDSVPKFYEYTKTLLKNGKAYACECSSEKTRKERFERIECVHRETPPSENLRKFEMMLDNKYDEEKISIRFKGDMKSDNTALRDPTIMRIKKHPHYRQGTKYIVWPTYDFNTPINDSINGVTDAIRTREFELRDELYNMILDSLGLRKPRLHIHARLGIKDNITSKRTLNKLISEGDIKGYDDPRLVTIIALRRRGVQPEAIKKFVLAFGMTNVDSDADLGPMFLENKKLLDNKSKRLYYVPAPVDITVNEAKSKTVELKLHPTETLGSRKYTVNDRFYISGDDAADLKNKNIIGLKGLYTLKLKFTDDEWKGDIVESDPEKKVQWVSEGNYVKCTVLVPEAPVDKDGNYVKGSLKTNVGYVESYASTLNEKDIVQFERFGFCILDDKKKMQFILTSR